MKSVEMMCQWRFFFNILENEDENWHFFHQNLLVSLGF